MIREKDIENYLIKRAKEAGILIRKCQWVGRNHCPDRLMMTKNFTVWVELKAPKQKPRAGQLREHKRMAEAGQNVKVVDSFEGVDDLIKAIKRINAQ